MTSVILLLLTFPITWCYGAELSSNARNFSIELMYFTQSDHFVISPFCVWSVMAGAYFGAHGETDSQIQRALIIPYNKTRFLLSLKNFTATLFESNLNRVDLDSMTFLFQDKDISVRANFMAKLREIFKARNEILDFQNPDRAANLANSYIQNFFSPKSNGLVFRANDFREASVVMSNVIYFKGFLTTPFNVSHTVEEIIYNENKTAIGSINMMYQKGAFPYSNFESMNSHVLELSYGDDGKFSILVILPYAGINPMDVFLKLDKITLKDILNKLEKDVNELGLKEIEVKLPRFRLRTSMYLDKPLNNMGIYDAFNPDFSKFNGLARDNLYIASIEHKADIMFSEAETVAFASTPGYFDNEHSSNLKANQPFIFFLIEKPKATLIFGGIYSRHRYLNELNSRIFFNDD